MHPRGRRRPGGDDPRAFRGVAERFGLTDENCPRHASNCTADWIEKDMDRGVTYFVLEAKAASREALLSNG